MHPILGGRAEIYRMPRSGNVFQFRMWIAGERKYVRKSLKTSDLETARQRAENRVFRIASDLDQGKAVFGATLGDLIDKYLEWRAKDVQLGLVSKGLEGISEGRFSTIQSQCRAIRKVKPGTLKLSELDADSFYDWQLMCQDAGRNITSVTVRNETATLNQIVAFGFREGLCHFPKLNFRPITIRKDQVGRRGTFSLDEYNTLVRFLRSYVSKKACPDDEERAERRKIRDLIYILSNTCLRLGELRKLVWGDIQKVKPGTDKKGRALTIVHLGVRAEIAKTRSARKVVSRGGEYFVRLKREAERTEKTDLVLSNADGTKPFPKRRLYQHWDAIMNGVGIPDYRVKKLHFYSLRHFGITCRIRSNVSLVTLAEMAGTSVAHIESHYAHVDDEMMEQAAMQNFSYDENGFEIKE